MNLQRKESSANSSNRKCTLTEHRSKSKSHSAIPSPIISSSISKATMTDEIVNQGADIKQQNAECENNDSPKLDVQKVDKIMDSLAEQLLEENSRSFLDVLLKYDNVEETTDTLLWDPNQLSEEQVVQYLKDVSSIKSSIQCDDYCRKFNLNKRQADCELALSCLKNCGYNVTKALQIARLGKFGVFVEDDSIVGTDSTRTQGFQPTQGHGMKKGLMNNEKSSSFKRGWTLNMKMNFEEGLILFGENVDKIQEHYSCFSTEKALELDLYLYSDERQKFIRDPEISRKIINILDQASHKHLQSLEVFEVGMDWARLRENILSSGSSPSESEGDVYCKEGRNQFGRIIRTYHRRKKRPKRLPNRFSNFQM